MKAIILLEIENGKSSAVVIEHSYMTEVEPIRRELASKPEIRKATVLVAGLTGRIVTMEQNDSVSTVAQISSW